MVKSAKLLPVLAFSILPSVALAQSEPAVEACHDKATDPAIIGCLDDLSAAADKHLNAAYQKTLKSVDPSAISALRAAERAWLEYRKQRCYYLGAGPGTIGRVVASDCLLHMTMNRADELDEDSRGVGPQ